jgi:hypothetical protein
VDRQATVRRYAEDWIENDLVRHRASTRTIYSQNIHVRLCPFDCGNVLFGDLKLHEVTDNHVELLVKGMARDHFSASTIKSCLHILDTLLTRQ